MKQIVIAVLVCLISSVAIADADLAKAKNCLSCHAIDTKVVGPAYKDVAKKYAGVDGIEDKLVKKVLTGSWGTWGWSPMPANTHVTESEARILVKWVLSMK